MSDTSLVLVDAAIEEADELDKQMEAVYDTVAAFEITDDDSFNRASELFREVDAVSKVLTTIVERFTKPAYAYWQGVLDEKKRLTSRVENARDLIRQKIASYRKITDQRLLEAKQEFATMPTEKAAEELHRATEGSEVEASGVTFRSQWKAEVTDLKELCKAIGDGKAPQSFVTFNQTFGNKVARSLRDTWPYPGSKATEDKVPVKRR